MRPEDFTPEEQHVLLAQLTRNQFVVSYVGGHLSDLKNIKALWHGDAKRWGNRVCAFLDGYDAHVKSLFSDENGMEYVYDAGYEYRKNIQKFLGFYEQAIMRILDKTRMPYGNELIYMAVSKDLTDLAAAVNGCELAFCKRLIPALGCLGSMNRQVSDLGRLSEKVEPTSMGFLYNAMCCMNKALLRTAGADTELLFDLSSDKEISRSIEISSSRLQEAFTDYKGFLKYYKDKV